MYKVEFQGKLLRSMKGMIFWFRWGKYEFDIRGIRKHFGKKPVKESLDTNFKMHPCTRFQTQMGEIMDLVGERNFEEVLLEIEKNTGQIL